MQLQLLFSLKDLQSPLLKIERGNANFVGSLALKADTSDIRISMGNDR
jgi:hypothetical protein